MDRHDGMNPSDGPSSPRPKLESASTERRLPRRRTHERHGPRTTRPKSCRARGVASGRLGARGDSAQPRVSPGVSAATSRPVPSPRARVPLMAAGALPRPAGFARGPPAAREPRPSAQSPPRRHPKQPCRPLFRRDRDSRFG